MTTFTVIICTYNRACTVQGAVESVLRQSHDGFELVVVDDGSTDETSSVMAGFTDPRVQTLTRPNGGLSAARNTGLAAATGDWVIFLDDDDRPDQSWLEVLAGYADDQVGLISCGCHHVDPSGRRIGTREPQAHPLFPDVLGVFLAGTFAVRQALYESIGGYAESIPTSHQTELILRLLPELRRQELTAVSTSEPLVSIESRAPSDRPLSQPEELLVGAEYLIERHGSTLAAVPEVLADYHTVAGVSAVQIGRFSLGRRHLIKAGRLGGWKPKRAARLALASVPPAARRVWGRHYRTTS